MNIKISKTCFRDGCEFSAICAHYKAERGQIKILPQHSGEHCKFYEPKDMSLEIEKLIRSERYVSESDTMLAGSHQ